MMPAMNPARAVRPSSSPLRGRWLLVLALTFAVPLLACTPHQQSRADTNLEPVLARSAILTDDAQRLPLERWGPQDPRAVVLALHGFTEHSGVFAGLAQTLAEADIALYAYDQRGFGGTRHRGIWPGEQLLIDDARMTWRLLAERYADRDIHLLGESMGGAVALLATSGEAAIEPASLVLLAPAVWGRDIMPWYQQTALWLGEQLVPGLEFDRIAARELAAVTPTDDPDVAADIEADERMLRDVRTDMIAGMTDLMAQALQATDHIYQPSLLLYGLEDEIIPPPAACAMFRRMEASGGEPPVIGIYPDGYHLLTRDLQAEQTRADIRDWLTEPDGDLPSGRQQNLADARERVCERKREGLSDIIPNPGADR